MIYHPLHKSKFYGTLYCWAQPRSQLGCSWFYFQLIRQTIQQENRGGGLRQDDEKLNN